MYRKLWLLTIMLTILLLSSSLALAAAEGYVGAEACASCHADHYQGWQTTWHPEKAGTQKDIYSMAQASWNELCEGRGNPVVFNADEPTGITGTRNFELADGTKLKNVDGVYIVQTGPLGKHLYVANFYSKGKIIHSMNVTLHTIGRKYRQVYNVNLGNNDGSHLLKYQFRKDRDYQWNDRNDASVWEKSCISCHVTGFDIATFQTNPNASIEELSANLGVGCEACHGPGAKHASRPSKNTIVNPANLSPERQVDNCAQCHIRGGQNLVYPGYGGALGFQPGDNIYDFFEPIRPNWGTSSRAVKFDGRAGRGHMTYMDYRLSPKYGVMACTDCHDMHGLNEERQSLKTSKVETCVNCHPGWTEDDINAYMNGQQGWEGDDRGLGMQHTFRLDTEGRVIGLPESEWPSENKWPWE